MDIQEDINGSVCRLRLAGELTIYTASEFKPRVLGALAGGAVLEVHAADVTEVDTAGVQLLLLAKREAVAAGKQMRVVSPSAAMQDALGQYYLSPALESL